MASVSSALSPPVAAAKPRRAWLLRSHSVLPGFSLSLGITVLYLSLVMLIPLAAVFVTTSQLGWPRFWAIATDAQVMAS